MGEMVYGSSVPQQVVSLDNITEPFPGNVWIYTVLTLLLFSFLSYTFHWAYQKLGHGLVGPESDKSNFFLFTYCKITEPEPLPWFDRVAGGKLCVTSWGIFCLFMIMFYQSNLRAHMITVKYERPIETLEDVLLRARKVWLPTVAVTLRWLCQMHKKQATCCNLPTTFFTKKHFVPFIPWYEPNYKVQDCPKGGSNRRHCRELRISHVVPKSMLIFKIYCGLFITLVF